MMEAKGLLIALLSEEMFGDLKRAMISQEESLTFVDQKTA